VRAAVVPLAPVTPCAAQGHGERLDTLTVSALDTLKDILDQPTALTDPKMLSIQKDTALAILGAKIRVDAGRVRRDDLTNLTRLLERMERGEPATFFDGCGVGKDD